VRKFSDSIWTIVLNVSIESIFFPEEADNIQQWHSENSNKNF
jgi:hypothetical protein